MKSPAGDGTNGVEVQMRADEASQTLIYWTCRAQVALPESGASDAGTS